MKIYYRPTGINNFHNSAKLSLVVGPAIETHIDGKLYPLSLRQAKKVWKHFCGISDCHCPHGAVVEYEQGKYGLPVCFVI